ncbi:hypothetical protein B0H15DRAFT_838224 [Mycena belliarum]|uniref:Postreplication repair E3 ubiquitin-protein ligase RAD18 n=1 Tax=Mycena belliarum TaxID=1033014 RepID=A0AAD6U9I0_9AGAR|nr:hypothetical protein B0H15DRAFT_838224 [Mycena belliae]
MNSNKLSVLLAQNVPDSTDFPVPSLRQLDDSLRCPICSKFYDGPVSLQCGHCFCSMCIRENLAIKPHCPACRQNANESHLRPNPVTEEVVASWKLSRSYVLNLAKQDECIKEPLKKKRRLDASCDAGSSRTSSTESRADFDKGPSDAPDSSAPTPETIVKCPVCNASLKFKEINGHMDNNCEVKSSAPPSKSQKSQWSDLMRGAPTSKGKGKEKMAESEGDRLPKVSYDTLKEKQLRDKLMAHGLPTTGERATLTRRHQRWTMMFNANLDKSASKRQSKAELRNDLKKWEEQRKNKKEKITVDESHLKTHDSEFRKLVSMARNRGAAVPSADEPDAPSSSSMARTSSVPPDSDIIIVDSDDETEVS